MRYIQLTVVIFLSFILLSCEEEIPWDTKEVEKILVVEGVFTNEYKHHRVVLSKSADYFSDRETPAVNGADVYLTSEFDTIKYIEVPDSHGVYETENQVSGVSGAVYKLHVHLQEPIRGETYYYASEEMINGISLKDLKATLYKNPIYQEGTNMDMDSLMLVTTLYGEDPQEIQNYYMVKLHEYSEEKEDTITNIEIYPDDEGFEEAYVNTLYFYESYMPGDTVQLEISTVSKQYYEFVNGVKKLATQEQDQFFDMSGPPANVKGNIKGAEALGYFRVSKVTKASTIVEDGRKIEN